jgi:hypothetical protein
MLYDLDARSILSWLFKDVLVTRRNQQQPKRVFLLTWNDNIFLLQLLFSFTFSFTFLLHLFFLIDF